MHMGFHAQLAQKNIERYLTYSDDGIPHVMVDKREAFFFSIIYTQVTIGSICVAAVHRQQQQLPTICTISDFMKVSFMSLLPVCFHFFSIILDQFV